VGIKDAIPLELSGTVKTYRYLDEDETKAQESAANGGSPAPANPPAPQGGI
jgi:type IV pilus assembly protein PilO